MHLHWYFPKPADIGSNIGLCECGSSYQIGLCLLSLFEVYLLGCDKVLKQCMKAQPDLSKLFKTIHTFYYYHIIITHYHAKSFIRF